MFQIGRMIRSENISACNRPTSRGAVGLQRFLDRNPLLLSRSRYPGLYHAVRDDRELFRHRPFLRGRAPICTPSGRRSPRSLVARQGLVLAQASVIVPSPQITAQGLSTPQSSIFSCDTNSVCSNPIIHTEADSRVDGDGFSNALDLTEDTSSAPEDQVSPGRQGPAV